MMHKVLIIDDEPWSRQVIRALGLWESLELKVVGEAEDGTAALQLIEELQPHIVVTDMRMPGVDGVELLQALSERFPLLKIIVMSGYDDFVYMKQAIQSRAADYLLKPINPEDLNAALAKCIRELEDTEAILNTSWRTPLAFADTHVLDQYHDYREQVFGYLLELNIQAVQHIFEKLGPFLESMLLHSHDRNILVKFGHDFILMLEEFVAENEIGFEHIWSEGNRDSLMTARWQSVSEAIGDISQFYGDAIKAMVQIRKDRKHLDLNEVKAHIDHYYQDPISLETIAQHFFISKEHLSRSFKVFTGENMSDYMIRKRMEKAKGLIVEQGLAIKHVAQMTGYADIAYFYRVFKKYYGFTPGQLRKDD
ncbi:MAG: response regulator [Paenibacillaceae bacterium]